MSTVGKGSEGQALRQGTEEWFKCREGKLTCSVFGQAAGLGSGSRAQLWRRLTKREIFEGNEATAWGMDHEPAALAAYQRHIETQVKQVGFVQYPKVAWIGGSPDGLVGNVGGVECKCPASLNIYEDVPVHYMAQPD